MDYAGTVIVVSHDRHFLNNVCTHIVDIDYTKIKLYVGNYDFWYESSQLMQKHDAGTEQEKRRQDPRSCKALSSGFRPTNPNPSQATSRRKLLEKLEAGRAARLFPPVPLCRASTMDREPGKEILTVYNLSKVGGRRTAAQPGVLPCEQGG